MTGQPLATGDLLGARFLLDAKLGQGAFGEVWRARDQARSDAPAAVKILFEKYHREGIFSGTADELRQAVEAGGARSEDLETSFLAFLRERGH